MTYTQSSDKSEATKTLPQLYCNRPSYQFKEPEFMKWDLFINTFTPKYIENNWEWIACRSLALKIWRKKTSDCLRSIARVTRSMFDNLLILDACFAALA